MHELYELKDMLCEELKEYGNKKDLSAGSLDVIDKLSHALKSLETIIAMEEAEYSNTGGISNMYPYYYRRGTSYARGGTRGQRRDRMGRYSRDGRYSGATDELADELRELMEDAPDEQLKQDIQRLINKIEKM